MRDNNLNHREWNKTTETAFVKSLSKRSVHYSTWYKCQENLALTNNAKIKESQIWFYKGKNCEGKRSKSKNHLVYSRKLFILINTSLVEFSIMSLDVHFISKCKFVIKQIQLQSRLRKAEESRHQFLWARQLQGSICGYKKLTFCLPITEK